MARAHARHRRVPRWLLGQQTGVDGMAWLLAALIPVGFGAWLYGRAARAAARRTVRAAGRWPGLRCW